MPFESLLRPLNTPPQTPIKQKGGRKRSKEDWTKKWQTNNKADIGLQDWREGVDPVKNKEGSGNSNTLVNSDGHRVAILFIKDVPTYRAVVTGEDY